MSNRDLNVVLSSEARSGIHSFVAGASRDIDEVPVRGGKSTGGVKQSKTVTIGGSTPSKGANRQKTLPISKFSADETDKIFELERDNTQLKSKENLLETEIVKMKTKLRRIEELMRKKGKNSSATQSMMPEDVQRHLQDEIDTLLKENAHIKERNDKLRAIERELQGGSSAKKLPSAKKAQAPINKFSNVQGKLGNTSLKKSDQEFFKLVEELKQQLVLGQKQIIQLTTHRDNLQARLPSHGRSDAQLEIDSAQRELVDIQRKMAEMRSNLVRDETMFSESKLFIERKQEEIQELSRACEQLSHKNFQTNLKAQQAKELSDDLNNIRAERDNIERSIAQITSYPFARNQSGQPSTQQRAAALELRLEELQKQASKIKEQEQLKWSESNDLRAKVQKLKGEADYIKGQHKEAKGKFTETHGEVTTKDVYRDLFKLDKKLHADTMNDIAVRPESEPLWKGYDFLERSNAESKGNDLKSQKAEITRMKHENKDLAAELDKAQSLLKLQTDIEKENREYHRQELERLKLLAQSQQLKAQEMAKRVDGQEKVIKTIKQRLGVEARPATTGSTGVSPSRGAPRDDDAMSDFEVDANDGEGRLNENFFDLRVIEAQFNQDLLNTLLSNCGIGAAGFKEPMTLVTVDFYDHATKTTELTQGYKPQYKSQFSFRSEMNSFYVEYLSKSKASLEVHLANGSGKPIKLGACDILLSELVFGERFIADSLASKTAVIEQHLNIIPDSALTGSLSQAAVKSLGSIKIKMRLRKPIQEIYRFHNNVTDIKNTTRAAGTAAGKPGSDTQAKKLVTIQVVACKDLSVAYGSSQIAPFFYYHFFTFDEYYSYTAAGSDPTFKDSQTYQMQFDDGTLRYLESQTLDIVFFDDNAPLTGIERGGQSSAAGGEVDDMIGIAKVPLSDLAKGSSINSDIAIKSLKGDNRGKVTIKITVTDTTDAGKTAGAQADIQAQQKQSFNPGWERDVIMRISRKLGRLSLEVELMFGIFSRGTKSCTREDFKYCCLQRLNLKNDISERELDMLLDAKLKNRPNIEQRDFVIIFQEAINTARNEALNQDALDRQLLMKYNATINNRDNLDGRSSGLARSKSQTETGSFMDFARKDAVQVLINCILASSYDEITREVNKLSIDQNISPKQLKTCLIQLGNCTDNEAQKILNVMENNISRNKFMNLLDEALLDAKFSSEAVKKFNSAIQANYQALAEDFISKDINKDGHLDSNGFRAGVIGVLGDLGDYKLSLNEISEVYKLISANGNFEYASYIIEVEPNSKPIFTKNKINFSRIETTSMTDPHTRSIDESQTLARNQSFPLLQNDPSLIGAKQKIEQFLIAQDVALSVLFNVIDTDSDKKLTRTEFKQKMRGLHLNLAEEELEGLFRNLDRNNDGAIAYDEFIEQFAAINTAQIVKRMRRILYGAQISAEYIFGKHCSDQKMNKTEFKSLISSLIGKIAEFEINSIFRELDNKNSGFIQKERFLDWFGRDEQEKLFQVSIEDTIKPLVTYLNRKQLNVTHVFDRYDVNKNQLLSASELQVALKDMLKFEMTTEEVQTMHEFFRAKFRRSEIKRAEFAELVKKDFVRKYDSKSAKSSLYTVKKYLEKIGRNIEEILNTQRALEFPDEVCLRGFKMAVFSMNVLTQQQVNNLAKYLDRRNNGMIRIAEVREAIYTDNYSPITINEATSLKKKASNNFS